MSTSNEIAIPSSIIIQLFTAFNVHIYIGSELFVGRATVGSNKIAKERAGVPYLTVAVCSIQENGSVPFRQILAGKLPLGLTTDKENVAICNTSKFKEGMAWLSTSRPIRNVKS